MVLNDFCQKGVVFIAMAVRDDQAFQLTCRIGQGGQDRMVTIEPQVIAACILIKG